MHHLTWTEVEIKEQILSGPCSLTAVTDTQLVLYFTPNHGNSSTALIFDTLSLSWKHTTIENPPCTYNYTSTTGFNQSVIIMGGECLNHPGRTCNAICKFSLILERKSLQHLAICTIYQHITELSLTELPKKLVCKIMGTEFTH